MYKSVPDNEKKINSKKSIATLDIVKTCERLSISRATAKNWIRLGKLSVLSDGKTFDGNYVEELARQIKLGRDNRLKNRRNKQGISGKQLYRDYIENDQNRSVVMEMVNEYEEISELQLRYLLSNFAIQLYCQSRGRDYENPSIKDFFSSNSYDDTFKHLIKDLLQSSNIREEGLNEIENLLQKRLTYHSSEDTLGFVYLSLRDLSRRRKKGAYYTAKAVVDSMIDSLQSQTVIIGKSIFDPCCGSGNFLLSLMERDVNPLDLYAQDMDEISVLIARINLYIRDKSLTIDQLYSHIICGNTLENSIDRKFSIIIGNPPWGVNYTKEETNYLMSSYSLAKSSGIESYELFIELGLSKLEPGGRLAFVLPEAIMNVELHRKVRELIAEKCSFEFVSYLGEAFFGVNCPSVVLGIRLDGLGQNKGCKVSMGEKSFIVKKERQADSKSFPFKMTDEEYQCLECINALPQASFLKGNAKFALGIVTGNNKEFLTEEKVTGSEEILRGSDIDKYCIRPAKSYIRFRREHFQQVAPDEVYRAKEKILYRFIGDMPIFAYDNRGRLSLNSCNILIPQIEGLNIKYILAILNSSISAFYISKSFGSVKLLRSHIEALPIPFVNKETEDEIIGYVDDIITFLEDKGIENGQITDSSQSAKDIYKELDIIIGKLYGLDENQYKTIAANYGLK